MHLLLLFAACIAALPTAQHDDGHGHSHGTPATGPVEVITGDLPVPSGVSIEPPINSANPRTPGARVVTKRKGPYTVKPGEMFSTFDPTWESPCKDCWVVAGEGTLEYEDGSEANINTGAYLHHMVIASLKGGGGPPPGVVGGGAGGPPPGVGGAGGPPPGVGAGGPPTGPPGLACDPDNVTIIGAGLGFGNERTATRFNGDGTGAEKYGQHISPGDRFSLILDLMNDSTEVKQIYAKVTYEIIEGAVAEGYKETKAFRLDTGACGTSEIPAQESGQFMTKSNELTVPVAGKLLFTSGHMHDSGTHIELLKNGEVICTSVMIYDRRAGYREPANSAHAGTKHISDSSNCVNFGEMQVGDKLQLKAYYDADKYPPAKHAGDGEDLHPVMGLAFVFFADL